MADEDDRAGEDEPLEEADAVDCEVPLPGCEHEADERSGQAHESEASLFEEIQEAFQPETIVMVESPLDGMPVPAREQLAVATAHPFTYETVVCIEDDRQYVELFAEELLDRGWSPFLDEDHRWSTPAGYDAQLVRVRRRYDQDGLEVTRRQIDPMSIVWRYGYAFMQEGNTLVPVRPTRERCRYYKRQVMANDDQPHQDEPMHYIVFRNCTKRRSVGGAYMTLRDEAIYACDYRDPPDPASVEAHLDSRDRERLDQKRHLQMVPMFNLHEGENT